MFQAYYDLTRVPYDWTAVDHHQDLHVHEYLSPKRVQSFDPTQKATGFSTIPNMRWTKHFLVEKNDITLQFIAPSNQGQPCCRLLNRPLTGRSAWNSETEHGPPTKEWLLTRSASKVKTRRFCLRSLALNIRETK